MKSFTKLVSEVAQPKAGDEIHFKAKHEVEKFPHSHADDEVFKGNTKKAPKRRADHEKGEDEEVYEAKKMDPVGQEDDDINNDGKVDSSDKYLHARRKAISKAMKKEAAEELDDAKMQAILSARRIQKAAREKETGLKRKTGESRAAYASRVVNRRNKMQKEEVEQLDELSPNKLHSYIKKATGSVAGTAAGMGADAATGKVDLKKARAVNNRMRGISGASGRLADKANMSEDAYEEVPMMMRQLQFIEYAAGEISDYLNMGVDPEEWFQNKLAGLHQTMLSMYAYAQGEMQMSGGMYGEEAELDESDDARIQRSLSAHKVKQDAKVKAGIPLRRPGEGLAAYVTRKAKAQAKMQKEEVELDEAEQLYEISKDLAKSYYRKAAKDIGSRAGSAQGSRDDAYSSRRKARDNYQVSSLGSRRTTDDDKAAHNARADRAISNAKKQERKIKNRAIGMSRASTRMEEAELDEASPTKKAITRALQGMKVQPKEKVTVKKAPWEKNEEAELGEVTRSAVKRAINYVDARGVTRSRLTSTRPVQHDEYGQEKIRESLEEAVKPGRLKLDDGATITVSKKDADLVNQMFNDLNASNRKKMQDTMMSDKAGFDEIVGFAREAL